ncbi:hypothetical protein [Marinimicrobium locisalis]|uniref:hypothetical protein n=1 Tax=Marinimicrobium locisalis TaxID=546022 RepID=UPI003221AF0A
MNEQKLALVAGRRPGENPKETEELDFLKQLGCHQYQGFLSTRPMLPEDIEAGDGFP